MSWRTRSAPATWTWRQLQNAPNHRPTLRCMLFSDWWATTGGSSKDLHALYGPLVSILPEMGLTRSQSGCHSPGMPWRPSRHWSRHAWQHLSWCFLTTPNQSCWRLMHPKRDWGQCCHRSRQTGSITLLPMAAGPWCHTRKIITPPNLSFWHWSGQLQSTLKSICPTSHS